MYSHGTAATPSDRDVEEREVAGSHKKGNLSGIISYEQCVTSFAVQLSRQVTTVCQHVKPRTSDGQP